MHHLPAQSDLARLEAMTDAEFWADAALVVPEKRVPVHIRLNPVVAGFPKRQGLGYPSRIIQALEHDVAHV